MIGPLAGLFDRKWFREHAQLDGRFPWEPRGLTRMTAQVNANPRPKVQGPQERRENKRTHRENSSSRSQGMLEQTPLPPFQGSRFSGGSHLPLSQGSYDDFPLPNPQRGFPSAPFPSGRFPPGNGDHIAGGFQAYGPLQRGFCYRGFPYPFSPQVDPNQGYYGLGPNQGYYGGDPNRGYFDDPSQGYFGGSVLSDACFDQGGNGSQGERGGWRGGRGDQAPSRGGSGARSGHGGQASSRGGSRARGGRGDRALVADDESGARGRRRRRGGTGLTVGQRLSRLTRSGPENRDGPDNEGGVEIKVEEDDVPIAPDAGAGTVTVSAREFSQLRATAMFNEQTIAVMRQDFEVRMQRLHQDITEEIMNITATVQSTAARVQYLETFIQSMQAQFNNPNQGQPQAPNPQAPTYPSQGHHPVPPVPNPQAQNSQTMADDDDIEIYPSEEEETMDLGDGEEDNS